MRIRLSWSSDVASRFTKLAVCVGTISEIQNQKQNAQLLQLKKAVYEKVKGKYDVQTLRDTPTVRAYRDFYWKLDIDPTKTRPSGEALLRRVLNGNDLPNISTVVDAYNLASMETVTPISGFDQDKVNPPFRIRFARKEEFKGIGMDKPVLLTERMLVLTDEKQILCVYPYRDSDDTKITLTTEKAVIVGYGALETTQEQIMGAVKTASDYIKEAAGGQINGTKILTTPDAET